MCTASNYITENHYFGRNFDYEISYKEIRSFANILSKKLSSNHIFFIFGDDELDEKKVYQF